MKCTLVNIQSSGGIAQYCAQLANQLSEFVEISVILSPDNTVWERLIYLLFLDRYTVVTLHNLVPTLTRNIIKYINLKKSIEFSFEKNELYNCTWTKNKKSSTLSRYS